MAVVSINPSLGQREAGPRIVYIVTCSERDFYAEMAAAFATLLRRLYPSAHVHLLVDELTDPIVQRSKSMILDLCDEYQVVKTGMTKPHERAWSMKSRMRQLVPGDFMFLDVDALPVRHFHEVFATECDFAAVSDSHEPPGPLNPSAADRELFGKLGWRFPREYYYNSGVVFMRDTPGAHALGRQWEDRWMQAWKLGQVADQLSLNSALAEMDLKVVTLPGRYNAQVHVRRFRARGAAILHVYATDLSENSLTVLGPLVRHLKQTGKMDDAGVDRLLKTGYPWRDQNWITGQASVGRYDKALGIVCRRVINRVCGVPDGSSKG